jgi:plastocyanin
LRYLRILAVLGLSAAGILAQPVDVSGTATIVSKGAPQRGKGDNSGIVVWLKPSGSSLDARASRNSPRAQFEIRQRRKKFEPHILPVPVGSVVSFPNLDPFFHNVFSLYDGNRFDLGLYEAGGSHSVRFDRPGVSYIFCNIHPEMSAVVVVVEGPYGTSNASGEVSIPSVAPGKYQLYAWHERARKGFEGFPIEVEIKGDNPVLPAISLADSGELLMSHKNKYGRDYERPAGDGAYK